MKIRDEIISSRNNPIIKWAASLSDKKGRAQSESFIAEGEKLVFEALEAKGCRDGHTVSIYDFEFEFVK